VCGLIILKGEKKRLKSGCIEAILEYKAIIIKIKKKPKEKKRNHGPINQMEYAN